MNSDGESAASATGRRRWGDCGAVTFGSPQAAPENQVMFVGDPCGCNERAKTHPSEIDIPTTKTSAKKMKAAGTSMPESGRVPRDGGERRDREEGCTLDGLNRNRYGDKCSQLQAGPRGHFPAPPKGPPA